MPRLVQRTNPPQDHLVNIRVVGPGAPEGRGPISYQELMAYSLKKNIDMPDFVVGKERIVTDSDEQSETGLEMESPATDDRLISKDNAKSFDASELDLVGKASGSFNTLEEEDTTRSRTQNLDYKPRAAKDKCETIPYNKLSLHPFIYLTIFYLFTGKPKLTLYLRNS